MTIRTSRRLPQGISAPTPTDAKPLPLTRLAKLDRKQLLSLTAKPGEALHAANLIKAFVRAFRREAVGQPMSLTRTEVKFLEANIDVAGRTRLWRVMDDLHRLRDLQADRRDSLGFEGPATDLIRRLSATPYPPFSALGRDDSSFGPAPVHVAVPRYAQTADPDYARIFPSDEDLYSRFPGGS